MNYQVTSKNPIDISTDILVIGLVNEERGNLFEQTDALLDGYLAKSMENGDFSSKKKETFLIHTFGKLAAKQILLVGLGKKEDVDFSLVRDVVAKVAKEASKGKNKHMVVNFDVIANEISPEMLGHALAEGTSLSTYQFEGYKRDKDGDRSELETIVLSVTAEEVASLEEGVKLGQAFAKGTNTARNFVNMPANLLTPEVFANYAVEVAKRHGIEIEVIERDKMEELGMGALLAVAQGSSNPPKLVVMKYQGRDSWDNIISYVGKGITFDTGGISLKPAAGMEAMIMDMGGAAAVIGAMEAIGQIKPKVNILAVVPMVENMPSGNAYRPGDVLTSMSGRTIEVISTDAEGRLILADAITYAKQLGASYIVDLATLTGAVLVALGTHTTAAMTNNDEWVEKVIMSAEEAGEYMWQLPTFDVYREQYKSRVADLKNTGGRYAGTITAGMFIGEFAEETPWVHLDIAGTAWADKGNDLQPTGATGAMVRTLARLALNLVK